MRPRDYCLLLAYELLYLWNALGACLRHSHSAIQIGEYHAQFQESVPKRHPEEQVEMR